MRKALLVVLILSSALAWAQGGCTGLKPFNGVTTGGFLKALSNQTIRVCSDTLNPCTTVPLFSDAALTQVLLNPVTTDAAGNYQYCVADGAYNEQYTSTTGIFSQVNNTPVTVGGPVGPQGPASLPSMTETSSLVSGTKPLSIAASGDSATLGIGFRDASTITVSTAPYISRDCAPTITATGSVSSVFCLQARPTYGGTGTVGTLAGLNFVPTVNAPVTKLAGVLVADALGSTNATTYNGVEVQTLTHCTTCRAFFSASNPSFFGGLTTHQAGITLGGAAAPLTLNASAGTSGQVPMSNGAGVTPSWLDTQSFPNRLGVGSNTPITDNNTFLSHRAVTGTAQFAHSFRAEDTVNTATNDAFAAFDSIVDMSGTVNYGHLIAFQARNIYDGSGTLAAMAGVNSSPVTNGPVTDVKHYALDESTGTSAPVNEYGLYVAQLTRASGNKFAIFTQGTTHSQFNGVVEVPGGVNFNGSGTLQISGSGGVAGQYLRSTGTAITWATAVRGTYAAYLNTGVTNGTQTLQTIKPMQPVTVERISINLGVPPAGCTSPTLVALSDGTNSASCSVANAAAAAECDVNVNFGNTLDFTIKTTQTTCTTAPSGMNVTAQYRMQ